MKIVHLCLSCFYIDDYSYQENMLPKYHNMAGHDVTVIASMVSFDTNGKSCLLKDESIKITKEGYKVIRIDYKRPFYKFNKFIRRYRNVYEQLKNEAPDIIFIHDLSFMDISKVIKYISKNKNLKVYVDCHTDYINSAQSLISKYVFHHIIWRYYAKKLSPFVEKFFGVTPLRCDFLKSAYKLDKNKVELLVMGIDDVLFHSKDIVFIKQSLCRTFNIEENNFLIVTGGKIDEKKNIHLVMQAINNLKVPNTKLIVFGTVVPEMRELFNSLLDPELIIYVGWLNPDQILDYLILADLVVFPGTHSVLWEQAVGAGKPCIFKYWQGMNHVDLGGNCEFLFEDSVAEVTNVLFEILSDDFKYKEMKKISMEKGLKKFSYSEIAKHAIEV